MDHIDLADCKHRYLYRLKSRNLLFGVFNESTNGFVGIREKFGDRYLFQEYHWDTGPPFGTVHPVEELGFCPYDDLSEGYSREASAEDTKHYKNIVVGERYYFKNRTLFDWIEAQQKNYQTICPHPEDARYNDYCYDCGKRL